MFVTAFDSYKQAAERLADTLGCPFKLTSLHQFPDGEHRLTLPLPLSEHLIVCCSLFNPNDKLIDLLLLADTARDHGVRMLTLVAPYFCYMRQDTAFKPGEAVSQQIIGKLLADRFNQIITVDPHLHRTTNFSESVPAEHAVALKATKPIAAYLEAEGDTDALLIGPDEESEQWVKEISLITGQSFAVAKKCRKGDEEVSIKLPEVAIKGRKVVLVDDMISTGQTMAKTAILARQAGAVSVGVVATHALFTSDAEQNLRQAGIDKIVTTDSVPHPSNRIWLADLLAAALKKS